MYSVHNYKPTVLSLFTGAGGMDLGFEAAGYELIGAVEKEAWATATLRKNHPNLSVIGPSLHSGDIRTVTPDVIKDFCNAKPGDIDVIIGGPPCQPFSPASQQRYLKEDARYKRKGFDDEVRGTLLFEFIRIIKEFLPRAFVIENVPGLMTIDGGEQIKLVIKTLLELGYSTSTPRVLNAANYGVPQFRNRLIVWGSRKIEKPVLPEATHSSQGNLIYKSYNTVVQALVGMPQDLPNHITREHNEESIARYRTLAFGKREKLGRVDRLDPLKPAKTVIAGGMSGGGRSHLHPFIARTLSVRECARLQTFDDDYLFEGTISRQFTQVGNAVPPLLAEQIARHIQLTEFGLKLSTPLHHGSYLQHNANLTELVAQLLAESRQQKPEWIYLDTVDSLVLSMS